VHFRQLSPEEPQVSHGIALALLSAGADESTEPLLACLAALEAILFVMKARSARKVQCTLLRHSRSTRHSPLSSARHHAKSQMRLLCCQQGLTICGLSLFGPRSLRLNGIGAKGGQHIGEALNSNKTLTMLECALAFPPSQVKMRSLCCQQGADSVRLLLVWPLQSVRQPHRPGRRQAHRRGPQEQHGAHHT
jgi:hypothetical protein